MAHHPTAKSVGLAVNFPACRVVVSQIVDKAKHVEPRAEDHRTRVQFPPPPPYIKATNYNNYLLFHWKSIVF